MEEKKLSAAELLPLIYSNSEFHDRAFALAVHRLVLNLEEQVAPKDLCLSNKTTFFTLLNSEFAQKEDEKKAFIAKHGSEDWCRDYIYSNAAHDEPVCLAILQKMTHAEFLENAAKYACMDYIIQSLTLMKMLSTALQQKGGGLINLEPIKKFISDFSKKRGNIRQNYELVKMQLSLVMQSLPSSLNPASRNYIAIVLILLDNIDSHIVRNRYAKEEEKKPIDELKQQLKLCVFAIYRMTVNCENLKVEDRIAVYDELSSYFSKTMQMVVLRVIAKAPDFESKKDCFNRRLIDMKSPFYIYSKYQLSVYAYHKMKILGYLKRAHQREIISDSLNVLKQIMWFNPKDFEEYPTWIEDWHKAVHLCLNNILKAKTDKELISLGKNIIDTVEVLALCQNAFLKRQPYLAKWLQTQKVSYTSLAALLILRLRPFISKLPPVDYSLIQYNYTHWYEVSGESASVHNWWHFIERKDISSPLCQLFYDTMTHYLTIFDVDSLSFENNINNIMHLQSGLGLSTEKATHRLEVLKKEKELRIAEEKAKRELEKNNLSQRLAFG